MSTIVFFHAHPDDEAIATGGSMMLASRAGHRVILVTATSGELGIPVEGEAAQGDQLGAWRRNELAAAAELLEVDRLEILGYHDSGMAGDAANDDPVAFARIDTDVAAEKLAQLLADESVDVLVTYDDNGGYGHPDHIAVHLVGLRAAEMAGVARVFESTMNRDRIVEMMSRGVAAVIEEHGADSPEAIEAQAMMDGDGRTEFGKPEVELTHRVDVSAVVDIKRAAMATHASQISPESWFMTMPEEQFAEAFGWEHYIERGAPRSDGEELRVDPAW